MLGRIALRIATIEAIKGKTIVGANVLDSEIGAIDIGADGAVRTAQDAPFISVYTDAAKIEDVGSIRALHKSGPTDLTIEAGITAAMTETDADTGESKIIGIGIPATDPAFEFYLDIVGRQVAMALLDPTDAWAEIWRGLSSGVVRIERKRTSDGESGTRIAAHQTVITVDLLADPIFGEPIASTSIWARFLAQMQAANHPFLPQFEALLGDPAGVSASEAQRRRFGLTLDDARALFDIAPRPAEATEPDIQSVVQS